MFGFKKKKEIKEQLIVHEKPKKTKAQIYKELTGLDIEEVKKANDN